MTILHETAHDILSKTILAADESTKTIAKRFKTIGVESSPEANRQYRQLLFTTPGIEQYLSGVILYDETIRQSTEDGTPFPIYLAKKGIIPGIKVDTGTEVFPGQDIDTFTKGLEGLDVRLKEYRELGARFAKWRAVFQITDSNPTPESISKNAQDLALYAKTCQQYEIIPIVEPEVLMDGMHTIERNREITERVLTSVFEELNLQHVDVTGIILKPNMITSGKENPDQKTVEEVAKTTLEVLQETVPKEVPGIAFLSGGQSPDLATQHLNAMNVLKRENTTLYPWRLTASYGRALQGEAIEAWGGKKENIQKAQNAFLNRAQKVYLASLGKL